MNNLEKELDLQEEDHPLWGVFCEGAHDGYTKQPSKSEKYSGLEKEAYEIGFDRGMVNEMMEE